MRIEFETRLEGSSWKAFLKKKNDEEEQEDENES